MVENLGKEETKLPEGSTFYREKGDRPDKMTEYPNGVFAIEQSFSLGASKLAAYLSLIRGHGYEIDQVIFMGRDSSRFDGGGTVISYSENIRSAVVLTTKLQKPKD